MTAVRRPHSGGGVGPYSSPAALLKVPFLILVCFAVGSLIVYVLVAPDAGGGSGLSPTTTAADAGSTGKVGRILEAKANEYRIAAEQAEAQLRSTVNRKREQFAKALDSMSTSNMPGRLKLLRDRNQIVGERLADIRAGTDTVQEVLNAAGTDPRRMGEMSKVSNQPPMRLDEIIEYLDRWIHGLHEALGLVRKATYEGIWQAYHDYTVKTLYVWDREYLSRMPPRRDDGSIFLSLASYRDENCINTIRWAYQKAKNPEKLFVGLVQQNCYKDCMSGILVGGKVEPVEPDEDVYKTFCEGEGKQYCDRGQVRVLNIDEPESLGPYAARYFASKLWFGEQWFMQTDAHMTFKQDWDAISVDMLKRCPSKKPVISHYPPSHSSDLEALATSPASRLCGPIFATSDLESQIIRLEGASVSHDHLVLPVLSEGNTIFQNKSIPIAVINVSTLYSLIGTTRSDTTTSIWRHQDLHPSLLLDTLLHILTF
jgi:[Skp1-protein]-hydroxyproline N-acetylglucosaminyltransferase